MFPLKVAALALGIPLPLREADR